jgi:hypothetical protein
MLRFLARWSLATIPIYLVVLIAGAVFTARPQVLASDYAELEWATTIPALFNHLDRLGSRALFHLLARQPGD